MKKWLNDHLVLTTSLLFRKNWSLHLGKGSFSLWHYCCGAEIVIFITGKLCFPQIAVILINQRPTLFRSGIFWMYGSMVECMYCPGFVFVSCLECLCASGRRTRVSVLRNSYLPKWERTTRSKRTDEKQVVKMKPGELMSSKVKAGKHRRKPVLTLSYLFPNSWMDFCGCGPEVLYREFSCGSYLMLWEVVIF